jgi:hypothetical protein
VHLDSLLFDLKYDPSVIEIPVPRYFREDDRIDLDIIFKEKVDRGGKKKKKKKKKKKGKKKAKKKEEEVKPPEPGKDEISGWIKGESIKTFKTDEPVHEVIADPFSLDMDFVLAIHIIQKNERGRQGRARYQKCVEQFKLMI